MSNSEREITVRRDLEQFVVDCNKGKKDIPPTLLDKKYFHKRIGYTSALIEAGAIDAIKYPASKRVLVPISAVVEFRLRTYL